MIRLPYFTLNAMKEQEKSGLWARFLIFNTMVSCFRKEVNYVNRLIEPF